jgi:hypothetical protein
MTYDELDHIDVPGEPFGKPGGVIINKSEGVYAGETGIWLWVEVPLCGASEDIGHSGNADVFLFPDGTLELVDTWHWPL